MKIEKISDSQIKFLLSQNDLKERNIKLAELAYGSDKTQALFREMMEQAVSTCGFEIENAPLMIEAIPVSSDSIMIIVSKVSDSTEIENKFNLIPSSKDSRKFRSKSIPTEEVSQSQDNDKICIYSFNTLDDVTNAASRLYGNYNGTNILFKHEKKYFLLVQNDNKYDDLDSEDIDSILSEYGQKHVSTIIAKCFLEEHAEILINNSAVDILVKHLA